MKTHRWVILSLICKGIKANPYLWIWTLCFFLSSPLQKQFLHQPNIKFSTLSTQKKAIVGVMPVPVNEGMQSILTVLHQRVKEVIYF